MLDGGSAETDVVVDRVAEARGAAEAGGAVVAGELRVGVAVSVGVGVGVGLGRTERLADGVDDGVDTLEATVAAARAGAEAVGLAGAQPVSTTPASRVAAATRRLMEVLVTLAPVVRPPLGGTSRPHRATAAAGHPPMRRLRLQREPAEATVPHRVGSGTANSFEKAWSVGGSADGRAAAVDD